MDDGSGTIDVGQSWWNYGGILTATGTAVFTGTSGTHSIQGGNQAFNILDINSTGGEYNLVQDAMISTDFCDDGRYARHGHV